MRHHPLERIALATLLLTIASASVQAQPIRPSVESPEYWFYHGERVLLLGGSKDDSKVEVSEKVTLIAPSARPWALAIDKNR